jgi:hypothetical protein
MRNCVIVRLLAVALVLVCSPQAFAQTFESVGTRAQGMGGAFTAVSDDASAAWWNPAGLASGRLFNLIVEHSTTQEPDSAPQVGPQHGERNNGFSVAFPALALSYYRLRISEIAPISSTDDQDPCRQDLGPAEVCLRRVAYTQLGATFGESIGNHLVLASTLKLVWAGTVSETDVAGSDLLDRAEELDPPTDTKSDLDLGAMVTFGSARFGVAVKHVLTPKFGEGDLELELPRQARAGAAWMMMTPGRIETLTLAVDADLTETPTANGDVRRVGAGIEAWVKGRGMAFRSGISVNTIGDKTRTGSVGITAGGKGGVYFEGAYLFGSDRARSGFNTAVTVMF